MHQSGILKKNTKLELSVNQSKLELDRLDASFSTFLNSGASFENGRRASVFAFNSQETQAFSPYLTLGKQTWWGGDFSFTHSLNMQDVSKWDPNLTSALSSDQIYFSSNTVSFSQDLSQLIWGNIYKSNLSETVAKIKISELELAKGNESTLYSIFATYLKLSFQKRALLLLQESLERSKSRVSLIEKRFQDGLAQKSDLFRTKAAFLDAENKVNEKELEIFQLTKNLELEVEQDFDQNYINLIEEVSIADPPNDTLLSNLDLKSLEQKRLALKNSLDGLSTLGRPQINLKFSYTKTSVEDRFKESFKESFNEDDFDEKKVVLSVSYPFDSTSEVAEKSTQLEIKKNEIDVHLLKKSIETQAINSLSEIKSLNKIIKTSKQRINYSQVALNDLTRRYQTGRVDLDSLLNAEEELINSETLYYSYILRSLTLKAGVWHLSNKLAVGLEGFNG
jgi:outer membrane protein TolC